MAQSTEDYLDSLLRQAMGIPDPEPETKPQEDTSDIARNDVFEMADGLTGSNSAILGNAYDQNASFTNQGEIEIPAASAAASLVTPESVPEPVIAPEDMPDPDAPVAISSQETPSSIPEEPVLSDAEPLPDVNRFTEELLPNVSNEEEVLTTEPEAAADAVSDAPVFDNIEAMLIPDSPIIEHDESNLDILPEPGLDEIPQNDIEIFGAGNPVAEEPAAEAPIIEEPIIEEPAAEAPVIEEPIIEEPVIEEPVIEEPVIEEPAIEEPVAEAAPAGISIDDLDPSDGAKALDADMIAALFENANAAEEPAAETPAIEEPAADAVPEATADEIPVEAPAVEEPVIEDAATEDAATEDAATEDLAIEEPAAEDPAADDLFASEDGEGLEEIDIQIDEEEAPLMPDQEISDLLSTLGELSGEGQSEEEAPEAAEETVEETAEEPGDAEEIREPEEPAAPEGEAADLGGIDMFDTDLSAMLDNVTNNLNFDEEGEAAPSDDADLNELLGSLDDGSGDLSDIGDLLEKDENSELVDPNTETAEALFASDSEEDIFNIDNPIEEEEPKRKKKKKFSLFGKKNKDDSNVEVIGGEEEMLIDPDLLDIPDESEIKPKKKGFLAAFFAKLFEEVSEDGDEGDIINIDQSPIEMAQEGAAENEAILSELEQEGEGGKKKEKKEKKKKEKKEKKGKKSDAAESEEGEEGAEAPKKKKKEKKKKEKLPEIPGKRLPRKKVVAISLFCITIGIAITLLAFFIPYSQDMEKAKKYYSTGEYQKTYEYMRGHKLTKDDQELYDRTVTLLRIKRPYDSYQNYMKMGLRIEALNALVQGVQMSDKYAEEAAGLGITDKYSKLSRTIFDELYNSFGVTTERARSWIELEGTPEYTRALYDCLVDTSGHATAESEEPMLPVTDLSHAEAEEGTVIHSEENDL